MKNSPFIRLGLILSLPMFYACNQTKVPDPEVSKEESAVLVQLSNRFAALDWKTTSHIWMTKPLNSIEIVKSDGTWYKIAAMPRVSLQNWADSSRLTTTSQTEFVNVFDPVTGQDLGGIPNKLKPDFYIERPASETAEGPLDGRQSRAIIAENKVIVVRSNYQRSKHVSNTIQALDLKSGEVLWTFHSLEQEILNTSFQGGKMYVGCKESSFSLDLNTGRKAKDYPLGGVRAVGGKYLFFWTQDKKLVAAEMESGRIKWEFGANGSIGEILVWDQMAVFTIDDTLYAVDVNSGVRKWTFDDLKSKSDERRNRIVVDNQTVFTIDRQLRINALELNTGKKKWRSVSFRTSDFDGSDMSMVAGKSNLYAQIRRDQIINLDLTTGDYSSGRTYWAADLGPIRDFMILY